MPRARVIGLLDMDYFFAQVEEVENPGLKGKPVVVCVFSGRSPDSGSVATCNYEARALGIRSAMPIFRAKQLAREKPETVFLPIRKAFYAEVSSRIFALVEKAGAPVERWGLDEGYFDWSIVSRGDFEIAQHKALELKRAIFDAEALTCSVGIGPSKLVAKMAASQNKPDGLTMVLPGDAESFVADFLVRKLHGVGPKTAQKLEEKGIRFVREVRHVNRATLIEWFGSARGTFLFHACRGIDETPVRAGEEKKHVNRIATLSVDSNDPAVLHEHLQPLALDLEALLAKKGFVARSVSFLAVFDDLRLRSKTRSLASGVKSAPEILAIALALFEKLRASDPKRKLRRAGISLGHLGGEGEGIRQKGLADFW